MANNHVRVDMETTWNPNELIKPRGRVALDSLLADYDDENAGRDGELAVDELRRLVASELHLIADDEGPQLDFDGAHTRQEKVELLSRLLDMEKPAITRPMTHFLLQDEVLELLVSFITRVDESHGEDPRRPRDYSNEDLMRRAYNAMCILSASAPVVAEVVDKKIKLLVVSLFQIFRPCSDGSLHHFKQLLGRLLSSNAEDVLYEVTTKASKTIALAVPMIHDPTVYSCIRELIVAPCGHGLRRRLFDSFRECDFMGMCARAIVNDVEESVCYRDVFQMLLDDVSGASAPQERKAAADPTIAQPLLFHEQPVGTFVAEIVKAFTNPETPALNQGYAAEALAALVRFRQEASAKLPISPLISALIPHIPTFCNSVLSRGTKGTANIHFSAYTTPSMSFTRLSIVRLVQTILCACPSDVIAEALDAVPPPYWKLICSLFFEYKHNNIYHAVFYRQFALVLQSDHANAIKALFSKTKLIAHLIQAFEEATPDQAIRGFVVVLCNCLRLTGEAQGPNGHVRQMLEHHHAWLAFESKLKEETLSTYMARPVVQGLDMEPTLCFGPPLGAPGRAPPPPPPSPAEIRALHKQAMEMPGSLDPAVLAAISRPLRPVTPKSIELGSAMAKLMAIPDKPAEAPKAATAVGASPAPAGKAAAAPNGKPAAKAGAASDAKAPAAVPAVAGGDAAKKKKNKKKKKKGASGAKAGEDHDDHDEDEGEDDGA